MRTRIVAAGAALFVLSAAGVAGAAGAHNGPNPNEKFPRRPGALYSDHEIEPGEWAALHLLSAFRVIEVSPGSATVEGRGVVPPDLEAPDLEALRDDDVIDGFAPYGYEPGDILHVTIDTRALPVADSGLRVEDAIRCTATDAADGTELFPYGEWSAPGWLDPSGRATASSTTTGSTTAGSTTPASTNAGSTPVENAGTAPTLGSTDSYIGIGMRRGTFYVRCGLAVLGNRSDAMVWRVDVS